MKVYCINYDSYAGKWIYDGYSKAWQKMGYEVENIDNLKTAKEEHYVMTTGGWVNENNINFLEKAKRVFLFVQPNKFPMPWGSHPNFVCNLNDETINRINKMSNITLWTFTDLIESNYHKWGHKIHTVPLAFDSISYSQTQNVTKPIFDVCYIGGWANNGFDEKRKIMISLFSEFKKTDLKCGFFINRGISHEQEQKIILNSKVCLNVHDAYQRILGLDTNERTFKTLGLNGLLVSDTIGQLKRIFPNINTSQKNSDIVEYVKEYCDMEQQEREVLKKQNKDNILSNHCYTNRVEELLLK